MYTECIGLQIEGEMDHEPCYKDEYVTLYNCDSLEIKDVFSSADVLFLDPPFDIWKYHEPWDFENKVCFTNWQNRSFVESAYGRPRSELIWHFKDGRWVSHNLPRITHESILVYGKTDSVYVGELNKDRTPRSKGFGCVGRDRMAKRIYKPKERKALNSVLEYPRNVSGIMGCWGKPVELIKDLLYWLKPNIIADPFAGGCSIAVAARELGIKTVACESDPETCQKAIKRLKETRCLVFKDSAL
jgi:hypothetical protein